jgi:hypothetical protein
MAASAWNDMNAFLSKSFLYGCAVGVLGSLVLGAAIYVLAKTPAQQNASDMLYSSTASTTPAHVYTNATLGFSLTVPAALIEQSSNDGEGAQTLTFQDPDANPPVGFQIYVVRYDDNARKNGRRYAGHRHGDARGNYAGQRHPRAHL